VGPTKGDPTDIKALGTAYIAGNAAYEDGSAKSEIDEINTALYENSNPVWNELRKKGVETSLAHLDDLCARLGTKFDKEFFESESGSVGLDIVRSNIGTVFEKSEGAVVYRGAHTRVFLNSRGLPTYEAKEVGLFEMKSKEYPNFDISLTVTGSEQKDFFAVVFDAIYKVFPERTSNRILRHIPNGFLKLTTGKMSSRLGNVITGESLLKDLTKAARGREDVAVGAIKYVVLKSGSGKDIVFDPEKSLSLEGDSGPYVQYALVRSRALLREAKKAGVEPSEKELTANSSKLERLLIHFSDVVERSARELEPHYVTTYLTELAGEFNSWYANNRVIGGNNPSYGVLLVGSFEKTMATGLNLLGIPAPEEM
jgi:arginyl-tRNA synthetase